MASLLFRDFPFHIRIEATQGCTRNCEFCGIQSVPKKIILMNKDTFNVIVGQLNNSVRRVDFALHGEPLMNPQIIYFVKTLREQFPRLQISILSNTDILVYKEKSLKLLEELFKAGLNFYHADTYDIRTHNRFLKLLTERKIILRSQGIRGYKFNDYNSNAWNYKGPKTKIILLCDESNVLNNQRKITRRLHNWGGNMDYSLWSKYGFKLSDFPMQKRCIEPFKCFPISATGKIMLCCVDWCKTFILGNIFDNNLNELWFSESLNKVRFALYNKRRDLIPSCYFCNKLSFRVGLYPYEGPKYKEKELKKYFQEKVNLSEPMKQLFKMKEINELP